MKVEYDAPREVHKKVYTLKQSLRKVQINVDKQRVCKDYLFGLRLRLCCCLEPFFLEYL